MYESDNFFGAYLHLVYEILDVQILYFLFFKLNGVFFPLLQEITEIYTFS